MTQKINNDILREYSYHPGNVFLWIGFGLGSILVLLISVVDSDGYWEVESCLVDAYYATKLKVTEEDGLYRYTINDRLLTSNTNTLDEYQLEKHVERYVRSKKSLPIWYSKSDKRSKKLDNIGI